MIQRINARGGNISLGAGAWIVCAALKDLGIKEKTAYPTRHKFINDFELFGQQLLEDQPQKETGMPVVAYDCKKMKHRKKDNTFDELNTCAIVSHPNNGHDAYVAHPTCGDTGVEVGDAVWNEIVAKKSQKITRAQASGNYKFILISISSSCLHQKIDLKTFCAFTGTTI